MIHKGGALTNANLRKNCVNPAGNWNSRIDGICDLSVRARLHRFSFPSRWRACIQSKLT